MSTRVWKFYRIRICKQVSVLTDRISKPPPCTSFTSIRARSPRFPDLRRLLARFGDLRILISRHSSWTLRHIDFSAQAWLCPPFSILLSYHPVRNFYALPFPRLSVTTHRTIGVKVPCVLHSLQHEKSLLSVFILISNELKFGCQPWIMNIQQFIKVLLRIICELKIYIGRIFWKSKFIP